ncbi:MAG: hypothetical protein M0D57_08835 [Sphingobacteriales bacterium JAD_PAG50586_3]|nr:MAG: hypothetical protein M0D57_08835 [Sphingobacteriales bacterium JAD_PAG50586_3]
MYGIRSVSTGTVSISNNNIGNISLSTFTGAYGGTFYGINTTTGTNTISGNTIGSPTLANSIQVTSATGSANPLSIQGIINTATSGAQPITNNIIANLTNPNTSTNANTPASAGVGGISVTGGGQYTITGNSIRNLSAGTSFSASTGPAAFGIISASTNGANTISNNLITDITSSVTTQTTQTVGISVTAGINTISNNKITVIRNNSQNNTSIAAIGINMTSSTAGQTISGNTIHSLITNANVTIRAYGINFAGSTTGATNTISANSIHSFTPNNSTSNNIQAGIYLTSGACNVINNVIRLGVRADNTDIDYSNVLVGIQDASTAVNNIYYNSVFITGASTSTSVAGNTYAMYRSATPTGAEIVRNNIFANNRTGGLSTSRHFAYASNTSGNITMDNNIFQTNPAITTYYGFSVDGTNAVTGVTALHAIRASISGQNMLSGIGTLAKINFTSATADTASFNLMLGNSNCAAGAGLGIAGITSDAYGYTSRATGSTAPTAIGAHESGSFQPISTTDAADGTDIYTPVVTVSAIGTQSAACGTTITIPVTATVTDVGTGVGTGSLAPTLWYKESTASSWTAVTAGAPTGNTYPFTANITGVVAGQTYYYYVAAQDQAAAPNVWYSHFNATTPLHSAVNAAPSPEATVYSSFVVSATSPLTGTVTVGATGGATYPSFSGTGGLFAAINTSGLSGNLTVLVRSNTTEDGSNPLNQWTEHCGTGYKVLVQPEDASLKTITGSVSSNVAVIRIAGADRVTFDGRYNGTGTTRYLKFANTYASSLGTENSVIKFSHTAQNDTVRFCDIEGQSTKSIGGVVKLAQSSSNIVINNNLIHGGSAWAVNCIVADTSSNITIQDNEIYNFMAWSGGTGTRAYGIRVKAANGSNWNINGNSIYNTGINGQSVQTAIEFVPGSSSTGNSISNNWIGGSSAQCGTGGSVTYWGNSYSGGSTETILYGMSINAGNVTIDNNNISNIWTSGCDYVAIRCIDIAGSTVATITNNTFGKGTGTTPDVTSTIRTSGGGCSTYPLPGYVYGVYNRSTSTSTTTYSNNKFYSLLQTGAYWGGSVYCIQHSTAGAAVITDNIISGPRATGLGWNSFGFRVEPTAGSTGNDISRNQIAGPIISLTDPFAYQSYNFGIRVLIPGTSTVSGTIDKNTIWDMRNGDYGGFGVTEGIYVYSTTGGNGNWDITNNQITLNNNASTVNCVGLYGIDIGLNSASNTNVLYNTVYISGSNGGDPLDGANFSSYAFLRNPGNSGTVTGDNINLKNNIFINWRLGASTSVFGHYAIANEGTSNFGNNFNNSDYNFLAVADGARSYLGRWGTTNRLTLANWQTSSGDDLNSFTATYTAGSSNFASGLLNADNLFVNPLSDVHISTTDGESYQFVSDRGTPITLATDFDNEARSSTPDIGMDEFAACSITLNTVTAAQTICSGTAPTALDGSTPTTNPSGPTYQWESSTTSATTGFTPISGATIEDYTPGTLSQTTWFRRIVYAGSCSNTSSAIQTTVSPALAITAESPSGLVNSVCEGSTTFFEVTATGSSLVYTLAG